MFRSLGLKLGAIGLLMLVLLIGLSAIRSVIAERQALSRQVANDIARSSSFAQKLTGPIVVVPYHVTVQQWREDPRTHERYKEESEVSGQLHFLPESFALDGKVRTEQRARGIYKVQLYHANNRITARFDLPARFGVKDAPYRFEEPFIAFGISDIRGIESAKLQMNNEPVKLLPGSGSTLLGPGVRAALSGVNGNSATSLQLTLDLTLQGTQQFQLTPVGRETQVSLSADWPHPSFTGDYLPVKREIRSDGFTAQWKTSFFSTNLEEALEACVARSQCEEFRSRQFAVDLIDPVDQYLKSERAIKYALLFIALTFGGFFLFEVLKSLAVHPIQYGLVGAALALFYLLLLSLSGHIGFVAAYVLSSVACVALIGFYVSYVLQSVRRGAGFALGLAALYGLLYALLSAEDYALLMGSGLLFALLAAVMVLTRNVRWAKAPELARASPTNY